MTFVYSSVLRVRSFQYFMCHTMFAHNVWCLFHWVHQDWCFRIKFYPDQSQVLSTPPTHCNELYNLILWHVVSCVQRLCFKEDGGRWEADDCVSVELHANKKNQRPVKHYLGITKNNILVYYLMDKLCCCWWPPRTTYFLRMSTFPTAVQHQSPSSSISVTTDGVRRLHCSSWLQLKINHLYFPSPSSRCM